MEDISKKQKTSELFQRGIDRYTNNLELRSAICQVHPDIGHAILLIVVRVDDHEPAVEAIDII
jgi:hypothetical protein